MKTFIKSLFKKQQQPKEFSILPMNLNEGDIHKTMFVSETRMDAMQREIDEVINHAEEYEIIKKDSKGVLINGPILLDILVNKIAKTDAERVITLIQFDKMINRLKRYHFGPNPLHEFMEMFRRG